MPSQESALPASPVPMDPTADSSASQVDSSRSRSARFPILLVLFIGSGCAALIYEIVWFQLLEHTIGSSAVSIAVLLATYMGGMCIGSLGLARVIPENRNPLRVYALLELGIGICGLAVLVLLPYAGGLYTSIGGHGLGGFLFRGLLSAICLLTPTILMGATLPAVARWVKTTSDGVSRLGFLYGANTLGSVVGCLLAGFYLLRVHDIYVATYVAMAINASVAGISVLLSYLTPYEAPRTDEFEASSERNLAVWPVLVTIGLSGFTALSAEVVWTRLLSMQLGATVYTYSLILAAILLGIGIGSYIGSFLTRLSTSARTLLGVCQALLVAAIAWSAYLLTVVLPMRGNEAALSPIPTVAFAHDWALSLWTVLPAALLWGASFPLALSAARRPNEDPGRSVGLVYSANTLGAIVGSLGTSLVAMATLGTQHIQQLLVVTAAASALLMLLPAGMVQRRLSEWSPQAVLLVALPLVLAVISVPIVQPVSGPVVGYGASSAAWKQSAGSFLYIGEGMNSSVAISELDGVRMYHNAGKPQASSHPGDMRLQRMLGHLTTLQTEDPESALVIGCGAGVTAGAVSIDPRVDRLTVVEIEPLVYKAARTYFSDYNEGVVSNPKTRVVVDDGRHYLMTSDEKYDAITCDPFDPWTKGAASLSTKEFFESARAHLKPGGTMTYWVPLYQTRSETVRSEIATFMSVFPNATVWDNVSQGKGAGDVVLSGRADDVPIDLDALDARLSQPGYESVRRSLASVGFTSADDLFATFGAQGRDMSSWLDGAQVNRDRNLRLQYLAGIGIGEYEPQSIYQGMVSNRTWPKTMFTGSPERLESLRKAMGL